MGVTIPTGGGNTFESGTFTLSADGSSSELGMNNGALEPLNHKVKLEFTAPIPVTTVGQSLTNVTTGATGVIRVISGGILILDTLTVGGWGNGNTIEFPNTDQVVLDNNPQWIITIPTEKKLIHWKGACHNTPSPGIYSTGESNGVLQYCNAIRNDAAPNGVIVLDTANCIVVANNSGFVVEGYTGKVSAANIRDAEFDVVLNQTDVESGLEITCSFFLTE